MNDEWASDSKTKTVDDGVRLTVAGSVDNWSWLIETRLGWRVSGFAMTEQEATERAETGLSLLRQWMGICTMFLPRKTKVQVESSGECLLCRQPGGYCGGHTEDEVVKHIRALQTIVSLKDKDILETLAHLKEVL